MRKTDRLSIVFVCLGNICRSPMAERIAEKMASDAGLTNVLFTSAATSTEEIGNPIDPRAVKVLNSGEYRSSDHRAHQITASEVQESDLIVCMETFHRDRILRLVPGSSNLALMTDFDPDAVRGSGIDDPWYGSITDFEVTRSELEKAMPGLLDWIRDRLAAE